MNQRQLAQRGFGTIRKVLRCEWRPSPRGYKIAHHLDCGHIVVDKESNGMPSLKLCRLCRPQKS